MEKKNSGKGSLHGSRDRILGARLLCLLVKHQRSYVSHTTNDDLHMIKKEALQITVDLKI